MVLQRPEVSQLFFQISRVSLCCCFSSFAVSGVSLFLQGQEIKGLKSWYFFWLSHKWHPNVLESFGTSLPRVSLAWVVKKNASLAFSQSLAPTWPFIIPDITLYMSVFVCRWCRNIHVASPKFPFALFS